MISEHRLKLILARIEILKLQADAYSWACHVPTPVKKQLEETLAEINKELEADDN